jgi:putative ECF transporter S component (TIGR02185 family)
MGYLHDYQYGNEYSRAGYKCVLPFACCGSQRHRYDAAFDESTETGHFYYLRSYSGYFVFSCRCFWFIPVSLVIGGVICDFLIMGRKEITIKSMIAAYTVFSGIFAFGAIAPIRFLQSAFIGAMERNNIAPEYVDGMLQITSGFMIVVIVAAGFVGGFIGGLLGSKMLKKHFVKVGLVSVD